MSFKKVFVAFILASLFTFALISFGFNMSINNNSDQNILDDPTLNSSFSDLEKDLEDLEEKTQKQREAFESDRPLASLFFFLLETIIGGGKIFTDIIIGFVNILFSPLLTIIGIPPIVLATFTAILIFSLILLAWRLYQRGE